MENRIVIAGGNGFLGKLLTTYFLEQGFEIIILSRKKTTVEGATCIVWDAVNPGLWQQVLEGATALINLVGKSVDCRYTEKNKKEIVESRVKATAALGKAMLACKRPPAVWLNASSATIYRHAEKHPMDEQTGEIGKGFSVEVCKAWEKELFGFDTPKTVKTALRIAMVLGNEGGVWPVLKKLTRLGLGGRMGKGTQYFSWIHAQDFCRAVHWLIDNPQEGAVNLSAPHPEMNGVFMSKMRKAFYMPLGLPQPTWLLEAGALLLQTETELVLKSRRAVPARLLQAGFTFAYPEIDGALKNLIKPLPQFIF